MPKSNILKQPDSLDRHQSKTAENMRLQQAEMLLKVSKTLAAFDTLDEIAPGVGEDYHNGDQCRTRQYLSER